MNSPSIESPAPPRPSTPSRLAFFIRQQNSGGGSAGGVPSTPTSMDPLQLGTSGSHHLSPDNPMHLQHLDIECLDWDSGYLEYLKDARRGIEHCSWACRDWSAPYDGQNPSPNTVLPPPPPTSSPAMTTLPEHLSFQQGGGNNTPPCQSGAAILSASRSEWSSSEWDSGEWDIGLGNNSISLTPHSKKRSLQREEFSPKPHCTPQSLSSVTPLLRSNPTLSSVPYIPISPNTAGRQIMYNGTMVQKEGCSDNQDRGLEVKKVKRDFGNQQYLDENANQNGSLVTCLSQSCTALPQSVLGNSEMNDAKSLCPNHIPAPNSQLMSDSTLVTNDIILHRTSSDLTEAKQTEQSVESLIQELLEEVPGEAQLTGISSNCGISIEAFTQELSELEDRLKDSNRAASQQEKSLRKSLSVEKKEEKQQSVAQELKRSSCLKGEAGVVDLCSPARPLYHTVPQPYTGENHSVNVSPII